MNTYISIGLAECDLNQVLANLALGETATLADENGVPIALLVSLQSTMKNAEYGVESKILDVEKNAKLAAAAHDLGKENEKFAAALHDKGEKNGDWVGQMKALAAKVDAAWQGEKSGLDELAEMRR